MFEKHNLPLIFDYRNSNIHWNIWINLINWIGSLATLYYYYFPYSPIQRFVLWASYLIRVAISLSLSLLLLLLFAIGRWHMQKNVRFKLTSSLLNCFEFIWFKKSLIRYNTRLPIGNVLPHLRLGGLLNVGRKKCAHTHTDSGTLLISFWSLDAVQYMEIATAAHIINARFLDRHLARIVCVDLFCTMCTTDKWHNGLNKYAV